jgi:hypothetical protein
MKSTALLNGSGDGPALNVITTAASTVGLVEGILKPAKINVCDSDSGERLRNSSQARRF